MLKLIGQVKAKPVEEVSAIVMVVCAVGVAGGPEQPCVADCRWSPGGLGWRFVLIEFDRN